MKKLYEAPDLEIEIYELNANIASNCDFIINAGPKTPGYQESECSDWKDLEDLGAGISLFSDRMDQDFYDQSCDCKYSATGSGYFTS